MANFSWNGGAPAGTEMCCGKREGSGDVWRSSSAAFCAAAMEDGELRCRGAAWAFKGSNPLLAAPPWSPKACTSPTYSSHKYPGARYEDCKFLEVEEGQRASGVRCHGLGSFVWLHHREIWGFHHGTCCCAATLSNMDLRSSMA